MSTVTDFQFDIGNGVKTAFTILNPSGDVSVSPVVATMYKKDWQGKRIIYTTPRRNIAPYSQDLSGSSWTKINITEAPTIAPDGSNTGKLTTATATGATTLLHTGGVATSTTMGFSIFAKTGGNRPTVPFIPRNFTTSTNFQTGTFNTVTGGITGAGWVSTPVAGSPGWFRLSLVQASGITVGNTLLLYCGASGPSLNAGLNWTTWGVQIEADAITPYIPTAASGVTVTDYSVAGSVATLSPAPLDRALLSWTGTDNNAPFIPRHVGSGSTTTFGGMGTR